MKTVQVPFAGGVDQKIHPFHADVPRLVVCENAIFDEPGASAKRTGHVAMSLNVDPLGVFAVRSLGSITSSGTTSTTPTMTQSEPYRLILLDVVSTRSGGGTPNVPTVTGGGVTWVQVATVLVTSSDPETYPDRRLTRFKAIDSVRSSGNPTVAFAGQTQADISVSIREWAGVDPAAPIVQTVTGSTGGSGASSLTLSMSAFGSSTNGVDAAMSGGPPVTPEAGWTEVHDISAGTASLETEYKLSQDTSPSATFTGTRSVCGIASEIQQKPAVTISKIWGITTRQTGVGDREELILFAERSDLPGQRKVFSWSETLSRWIDRGDYEGIELTQVVRTQNPANQHPCDQAGGQIVTWYDSDTSTVRYQIFDPSGVALTPVSETESGSSRPACVQLGTKILLFWYKAGSSQIRLRIIDTADVLGTYQSTIVTFFGSAAAPYDVVKKNATTAYVLAVDSGGAGYAVGVADGTGFVTSSFKSRTTDLDSGISIAYQPTADRIAVVRSDGTNMKGDILNGTSLADVVVGTTIVGLSGGDIGRIAMAFRQTAEPDGTYRAVILWQPNDSSNSTYLRYFGTDGATGILTGFQGDVNGACRYSRVAGRAFARGGKVFFVVMTTAELVAQQWTYILYREDGLIVARFGTWSAPDPLAQTTDRVCPLPQVEDVGGDVFRFAAAYRNKATIYDNQFADTGVKEITFNWSSYAPYKAVQLGRSIYCPGGYVMVYDGYASYEAGFFHALAVDSVTATGSGGSMNAGVVQYRLIPEWRYANGEIERGTWVNTYKKTVVNNDHVTFLIHNYPHTRKRQRVLPDGYSVSKDVPPLSIVVYRTKADQAEFYRNSDIDPANSGFSFDNYVKNQPTVLTQDYADIMADSVLGVNERLYTDSTPIDHVAPESCSVIAVGQGRIFLAGHENPDLVTYSLIWRENEAVYFHDAYQILVPQGGGRVTAIHPTESGLLIFKQERIYYVPGTGPDNTGHGTYGDAQLLSADVGAVAGTPIVQVPSGWMFVSAKGIRLLDRSYSVEDIGAPVVDQALAVLSEIRSGFVIRGTANRVLFLSGSTRSMVLDYFDPAGQWSTWTQPLGIAATPWKHPTAGDVYVYVTTTAVYRSSNVYQDAGVSYNHILQGRLRLAGPSGFVKVWWVTLLGEYMAVHNLRVRFSFDYSSTWTDDRTWTPDATLYELRQGPSRGQFSEMSFRIEDVAQGGNTLLDSFKAVALSVEYEELGGHQRQPAERSQ